MLLIRDVMTRNVVTLRVDDTLENIERNMSLLSLRHLPVVDGEKLVGLITHRDVLRMSVSTLEPGHDARDVVLKAATTARQVMRRGVRVVRPETTVLDAVRFIVETKFGCLPVVEGDQRLVGIVTEHDFLVLLLQMIGSGGVEPTGEGTG